jgi:hypothetical protein
MTTTTKPPLNDEEAADLAHLLELKYAAHLDGRTFEVTTEIKDDAVYGTVILRNADDSFYYPLEARIKHVHEEMSAKDASMFLVDYLDYYLDEYFTDEAENLFIPIDWTDRQWDAVDLQIRGQVFNKKIDKMADELLASGETYSGRNIII